MSGKGRGVGRGRLTKKHSDKNDKRTDETPTPIAPVTNLSQNQEQLSTLTSSSLTQASNLSSNTNLLPIQDDDEFEPYDPSKFEEPEWIQKNKKKETKKAESTTFLIASKINPVSEKNPAWSNASQNTRTISTAPSSQNNISTISSTTSQEASYGFVSSVLKMSSPAFIPQSELVNQAVAKLKIEENVLSNPLPVLIKPPTPSQQVPICKEDLNKQVQLALSHPSISKSIQPSTPTTKMPNFETVQKVKPELVRILNGEFVAKPKERGTLGRTIKLRTNHYAIGISKSFNVYQYDVEIKKKFPDKRDDEEKLIKNKTLLREMFLILTNKILKDDYNNKIVYNFSKNMYSLKKLPFESQIVYEMVIDAKTFLVQIKIINQVQIDFSKTDDPIAIQLLDLIFTQGFNYTCININRSFFKETGDYYQLNFGLQLWKGAYASVRPSECGLTWNVDSANAAFLISENVLEACAKNYGSIPPYEDLKGKIEKDKDSKTIGLTFLDRYKGREIKTDTGGFRKKIAGFGPDAFFTFDLNKGEIKTKISIKDYIFQNYNKVVMFPQLPCIDLGRNSFLPMEFCRTEIKNKKKLSNNETIDMIKATAVKAPDRMNYIQNWTNSSSIDKDPVLKEYNISINLKLIEMEGRVLEAPDVQYGGTPTPSVTTSKVIAEKGSWDHRNCKFVNSIPIKKWVVLNFSHRIKDSVAYEFASALIRIGKGHGMNIAEPLDYGEIKGHRAQINEDVRRLFENMVTKYQGLEMIVAIFGGQTTIYNTIKTCGDIGYGITTQGVEDKNVSRIKDQTISNILLKINTKLGGRNWFLSRQNRFFSSHLQELYQGPLMIFGADVTHPSPGDLKVTESIAAVVGSLDKECSFYAARLFAQKSPKGQSFEMIHSLNEMFLSLLNEFYRINKTYPKRLVFFRDGVSEGQFSMVLRWEMNKIREACQSINTAYKPAVTFVLVQKRHHTRLFPVDPKDKNGTAENVPPGTIVDKQIVSKSLFDFFLCSHVGIQGTSRPCHYYVLHDENNFKVNQIQLLSHYLCHIYSRCSRSVSYPAPAYYAHLAAFRGRDYIRKPINKLDSNSITSYQIELHPNVKNKMFYN